MSEDHEAIESKRRMANVVLRLVVVSIPVAAVVLYFGTSGRRQRADVSAPTATSESVRAGGGDAVGAPDRATAEKPGRLAVGIVANRALRISTTIDGQPVREQQLASGQRTTFDAARELLLKVDDAAGISWTVNGQAARPLGVSGAASAHLTLDNYKGYLSTQ
jgi:hypothetical protein